MVRAMPVEDRVVSVLDEAELAGKLQPETRRAIQLAMSEALASERVRLRTQGIVAMSEEDAVRYRVISELATDWVYAARQDADGNLRPEWTTDAAKRITGYSTAELNARGGLSSMVVPEDRPRLSHHDREHREGLPSVIEYRINTKSGQTRWLRDYRRPELDATGGRVVRIFGAVKDITEEKLADEARRDALRQLEQRAEQARFRSLLDHAGESIFVIEPHTLGLVDVNATACRELGYSREALLTMSLDQIQVGPQPRESPDAMKDGLSAEQAYRRKNGDEFPVEVTVARRRFDGLDYLVVVAREISERKEMEAQLAQAGRLATVGELAAGVAHEVNNPLAYIMNNLGYAIRSLPDGLDNIANALRDGLDGAKRVREVVQDLKRFSRSDEEQVAPTDIQELLDSAIKLAHNEIRHRATLVRQYSRVPPVDGDGRLAQVFLNLVLNAVHSMDEGDVHHNRIVFRIENRPEQREVAVSISDTGSGIAPEKLGKIFDPFFTTKPTGVGTGLGLSICRNITESMGGRIEVESELGAGATFTVTLRQSQEAFVTPPRAAAPTTVSRSLKVLVVDDDVPVARSLGRLLKPRHQVTLAASGRQALSLLEGSEYDVIFCDVMMPEMTGMELYKAVSRKNAKLSSRFVFITGGPFTPEARELFDEVTSNNPWLQKPFSEGDLLHVLEVAMLKSETGRHTG